MADVSIQQLKEIAAELGLEHSPNIGRDTLKTKIKEYCIENNISLEDDVLDGIFTEPVINTSSKVVEVTPEYNSEIEALKHLTFASAAKAHAEENKHNAYKKAMKLVRCIVTCNDKNKSAYSGDIFFVRNKDISGVKKFIPFNVPTHIPQILFNVLKEKQLQTFVTKRLPNGMETKISRLVPMYNIDILPPLTTEEFNSIRQKQLAEGIE